MITSQQISWQPVIWEGANDATEYAIFVNGASTPAYTVVGGATSAIVQIDDALNGYTFQIRPTDGTNYGAAQTVVVANQPLNNRAWVRDQIRKRISDRTDTSNQTTPTILDDEINGYLNDSIREYSIHFPLEKQITITLIAGGELAGARDYQLPADFYEDITVLYNQANSHLQMYLKPEGFKGGETTATSWIGYPKLGILQPPIGGRFYPGHYDIYEGSVHLDFDPLGNGDTLQIRYGAIYPYPTDDVSVLQVPEVDLEMILKRTEASCWLEVESKDVRLSRWDRGSSGSARRDDMPTEKMSTRLFNAWNMWVNERRSMRPQGFRLVRRT